MAVERLKRLSAIITKSLEGVEPTPRQQLDAVSFRVKLLEWEGSGYGVTSRALGGTYCINNAHCGGYNCHTPYVKRPIPSHDGRTNHATINDAKAAAQADYERRILSTLEVEKLWNEKT
jgi:hypothetical protein